jgi:hypothetical protein
MQFRLRRPLMAEVGSWKPARLVSGRATRPGKRSDPSGCQATGTLAFSGRNRNTVLYIFLFEEPNLRAAWRFAGNKEKMSG